MRVVSAAEIDAALTFPALIDALEDAFREDIVCPVRSHHDIARPHDAGGTLLLMPAWTGPTDQPSFAGTKIVSVFPQNAARGKASVNGVYVLLDGQTGEPLAALDGTRLTLWRTAAASALAARYLGRHDAVRLVMVGAGALSPYLIRAHAAVRPIKHVRIWARRHLAALDLAQDLANEDAAISATEDLEGAVRAADIVTCATMTSEPLVRGAWLREGAHLDLVGAYRPTMRESDDEAVRRASLFCDTRAGATKEGGDLADPIARGVIRAADIRADLFDLVRGTVPGRTRHDEITLFKSVGTAIEDLAAAMLVWRTLTR